MMDIGRFVAALTLLIGSVSTVYATCTDRDGDGYFYEAGCGTPLDCNDFSASTHPGSAEFCDGIDNDCDGAIDDAVECTASCAAPRKTRPASVTGDTYDFPYPSLAWNGSSFGATWDTAQGVAFRQLTEEGEPLGSQNLVDSSGFYPSILWTGTDYGVFSMDYSRVYFTRLGVDGTVHTPTTIVASDFRGQWFGTAWTGAQFGLATINTDRDVVIRFLSTDGVLIAGPVAVAPGPADTPVLAWSGGGFGVVWIDGAGDVFFREIDSDGQPVSPIVKLNESPTSGGAYYPTVGWTGDRYTVAWGTAASVLAQQVGSGATLMGPNKLVGASTGSAYPKLVWTGQEIGVAWNNFPAQGSAQFRRLDGEADPLEGPRTVSSYPVSDDWAHPGWNGHSYVVLTIDRHDVRSSTSVFSWRLECTCDGADSDGDTWTTCAGDCDDLEPAIFPGSPQVCDSGNNDCSDELWPRPPIDEEDADGDFQAICQGDCDDSDPTTFSGAPQLCDGKNNDCSDGSWPAVPTDEYDADGDGARVCAGDCNDSYYPVRPGRPEVCNCIDDNCDGNVDEGFLGCESDLDGDGFTYRPPGCGIADDCNDLDPGANPAGIDTCDGVDNDCDGQIDNHPACVPICANPRKQYDVPFFDLNSGFGYPFLVWSGSEFGVAWGEGGVRFRTLAEDGSPSSQVVLISQTGTDPVVVWTGAEFGVFYSDVITGTLDVYLVRFDVDGVMLAAPVKVAFDVRDQWIAAAWDGARFALATVTRSQRMESRFLSGDGTPFSGPFPITSNVAEGISIAWNGTDFGVVWIDRNTADVRFQLLDSNGQALRDPLTLNESSPAGNSYWPWLLWMHDRFTAVWGSENSVVLQQVAADGSLLGVNKVVGTAGSDSYPKAVWTGGEIAVAWNNFPVRGAAQFRRLDRLGNPLEGTRTITAFEPNDNWAHPAWNGQHYVVGILDRRTVSSTVSLYSWRLACTCSGIDADGDGVTDCAGDCDESDPAIFPGAPEACDRKNSDCDDPRWPRAPDDESDLDGDGFAVCEGDCDDSSPNINPQYPENCNQIDDNCNGEVDEDELGLDSDLDEVNNACDNCRLIYNPAQEDGDVDRIGDVCDNCPSDWNPTQSDFDADLEGDRCDLNDGLLFLFMPNRDYVEWQREEGTSLWNAYKGDFFVLEATGVYTQVPYSNQHASRECGLLNPVLYDSTAPWFSGMAFYLATSVDMGVESSLGQRSDGTERPNDNPCP